MLISLHINTLSSVYEIPYNLIIFVPVVCKRQRACLG